MFVVRLQWLRKVGRMGRVGRRVCGGLGHADFRSVWRRSDYTLCALILHTRTSGGLTNDKGIILHTWRPNFALPHVAFSSALFPSKVTSQPLSVYLDLPLSFLVLAMAPHLTDQELDNVVAWKDLGTKKILAKLAAQRARKRMDRSARRPVSRPNWVLTEVAKPFGNM